MIDPATVIRDAERTMQDSGEVYTIYPSYCPFVVELLDDDYQEFWNQLMADKKWFAPKLLVPTMQGIIEFRRGCRE